MWDNLGRNFAEFFHLDRNHQRRADDVRTARTVCRSRRAAARRRSRLQPAYGQLGDRVAGRPRRFGWRPAGVYQTITNPFVDRYVNAIRAPLLSRRPAGEIAAGRANTAALCARGRLRLIARRPARFERARPSPFLVGPAPSTPFPATVARSVGVPLYAFRVIRTGGARFSVRDRRGRDAANRKSRAPTSPRRPAICRRRSRR